MVERTFCDADFIYNASRKHQASCHAIRPLRAATPHEYGPCKPRLVRRASMIAGATADEMLAIHEQIVGTTSGYSHQSIQLMEHGVVDGENCEVIKAHLARSAPSGMAASSKCFQKGTNPEASSDYHRDDTGTVAALSAGMVCAGCMCQLPHELMNTRDKGCGDLISLVEYLAGLLLSAPTALRKSNFGIAVRHHILLAVLGVLFVFFTNLSLASRVPTTIYVALKNGTLVANLAIGIVVLRKRYTLAQHGAIAVTTFGLVSTAMSARLLVGTSTAASLAP